jgi:hypothetical protein
MSALMTVSGSSMRVSASLAIDGGSGSIASLPKDGRPQDPVR